MKHVHVCLVSDQPIPNLTTVFQFKPDKVVLLKTKEMDEKTSFLQNVLNGKKYDVEIQNIQAYNIDNVIDVSETLINKYSDCKITLNITGGTKLGTLGTFQAFYTKNKEIFYVDTKNNKILQLSPTQQEFDINASIQITDYLSVYGFKITEYVQNDNYIYKRKELTNYLASTVKDKRLIQDINSALHEYNENIPLPISVKLPNDESLFKLIKILDGIKQEENNTIKINNPHSLMYLKGFWFEEYVYMKAKEIDPDEIKLNVKGKWMTKGKGQYQPRNEFDVMFSKRNRLFYISCKTANPNRREQRADEGIGKEYIYELVSLGDRALGLFGKRMLASARRIHDPAVRERAKILNVTLVDGKNIITLKETLRQWIKQ